MTSHRNILSRNHAFAATTAMLIALVYGGIAGMGVLHVRSLSLQEMLTAAALMLFTTISLGTDFEFTLGGERIPFSPDSAANVLAAIFLPLWLAVAVCALPYLLDLTTLRRKSPVWRMAFNGMTCGLAAGGSTFVVQAMLHGRVPSGPQMLPVAVIAAAVLVLSHTLIMAMMLELRESGSGRRFLASYMPIAIFEVVITSLAVVVTIPFMWNLLFGMVILTTMQMVLVLGARVSTSESLHRVKNEYLRDVFSRYVPAHVADALADSGQEIKLGGEQREISVLFCDIRGFTAWSEDVGPETVITELNVLLGGLSASVMKFDGTLDKYTGDGLMAFWGAPLDQPDHADRASAAAIEMLHQLEMCNLAREQQGLPAFAIGIGVHSGLAVVGNVGHEDRLDYTAIGDTVNTSARLEAATKEVGSVVLFSDATYHLLAKSRRELCEWVGRITVKGRAQQVDIYTVIDATAADAGERWEAGGDGLMPPDNATWDQAA